MYMWMLEIGLVCVPLCENFQGVSTVILNLARARENVQD